MPLVVGNVEGGGATLYGTLLTLIGTCAVAGRLVLSKLRARLDANRMAAAGSVGTALAMIVLALAQVPVLAGATVLLDEFSWIAVLTMLLIPAALLVAMIPITWRFKLGQGEALDLSASSHWPAPEIGLDEDGLDQRGPVMLMVEYQIRAADEAAFVAAANEWSGECWRDGAFEWRLYQSADDPSIWIEAFSVSSWEEHLAQHEHVSKADQDIHPRASPYL